jgi:hypothetical protein
MGEKLQLRKNQLEGGATQDEPNRLFRQTPAAASRQFQPMMQLFLSDLDRKEQRFVNNQDLLPGESDPYLFPWRQ